MIPKYSRIHAARRDGFADTLKLRAIIDRPMSELWGGHGEVRHSNYRSGGAKAIPEGPLLAENSEAAPSDRSPSVR